MARESEYDNREGTEGSGATRVELHMGGLLSCLDDKQDDDVSHARKHERTEVPERIELLGIGKRPHNDAHNEDPEPPLGDHSDVPLLLVIR